MEQLLHELCAAQPADSSVTQCPSSAAALMGLLGVLDFLFVNHACHSIITRGASVQLVFGFEVCHPLTELELCDFMQKPGWHNAWI